MLDKVKDSKRYNRRETSPMPPYFFSKTQVVKNEKFSENVPKSQLTNDNHRYHWVLVQDQISLQLKRAVRLTPLASWEWCVLFFYVIRPIPTGANLDNDLSWR